MQWKKSRVISTLMRQKLVIAICVFYSMASFGQVYITTNLGTSEGIRKYYNLPYHLPGTQFSNLYWDTDSRSNLNAFFNLDMQSNTVSNSFMRGLISGKFISDKKKKNEFERLKDENMGGVYAGTGISYLQKSKKWDSNHVSILVKYKVSHISGVQFTDDFFELLFDGNSRFEGKKADFSGLSIQTQQYNQIQFGITKPFQLGKLHAHFGGLLSLNVGNRLIDVDATRGSIFTATDGEYLDLDWQLSGIFSDTANTNFFSANGLGASTDLVFGMSKNSWYGEVSVSDLGFIHWNDGTLQLLSDTIFRFEGIELNNFLGQGGNILEQSSLDSLTNLAGIESVQEKALKWMPTSAQFFITKYISSWSSQFTFGAVTKWNANYNPLFYFKYLKHLNKLKMDAGANLSFGGHGSVAFGILLNKIFANKLAITFGTNSLLSQVATNFPGISGYTLISWSF